jgi:hypothetical protein
VDFCSLYCARQCAVDLRNRILSDYSIGLESILLDEALGAGLVEVTEIDDPRESAFLDIQHILPI